MFLIQKITAAVMLIAGSAKNKFCFTVSRKFYSFILSTLASDA